MVYESWWYTMIRVELLFIVLAREKGTAQE